MATLDWPTWCRPCSTDEIMPLDVTGPDGPISVYTVAVTLATDPQPLASAYSAAEQDGAIRGPRVGVTRNHLPGNYLAWPKVGGRVLPPVSFTLF